MSSRIIKLRDSAVVEPKVLQFDLEGAVVAS